MFTIIILLKKKKINVWINICQWINNKDWWTQGMNLGMSSGCVYIHILFSVFFSDLSAATFLEFVLSCWLMADFCGFPAGLFVVWLPVRMLASVSPWDHGCLTMEKYLGNKHKMCFHKHSWLQCLIFLIAQPALRNIHRERTPRWRQIQMNETSITYSLKNIYSIF